MCSFSPTTIIAILFIINWLTRSCLFNILTKKKQNIENVSLTTDDIKAYMHKKKYYDKNKIKLSFNVGDIVYRKKIVNSGASPKSVILFTY